MWIRKKKLKKIIDEWECGAKRVRATGNRRGATAMESLARELARTFNVYRISLA